MFVENLSALMDAKKINRRQLSIGSGIPYSTIDTIFKKSDDVRLSTLIKLADFFSVSLDFLVRGEHSSNPHEVELLMSYRRHPEMQPAVDRLLGVEPETKKDEESSSLDGNISVVDALGRMKKTQDTR